MKLNVASVSEIMTNNAVFFSPKMCIRDSTVRDGDIAHIVFGEKDFDIAASFDIIPAESG